MSDEWVFTKFTGPVRCFSQFIPDLGLAYVSAALKQAGITGKLIDLDLPSTSPKDLIDYLEKNQPAVLAVKMLRVGFSPLVKILEEAKKASPNTLIIGGGAHARLCQETVFDVTGVFDVVLTGEAERAIPQLVEVVRGKRKLDEVENILYRDENGQLVKQVTVVIPDLDSLPLPDWSLYDLEQYLPVFLVSARRGCPFSCAFCNFTYSRPPRKRKLPGLQKEICHDIDTYGARLFSLADSLPDVQLTLDLSQWLIDSKMDTRWTSFGRVKYMDSIFETMARAGWVTLWFGIEAGSNKILQRMNKLYKVEDVRKSIHAAHAAGIKCIGGFIMGFPGEDEQTLAETFRLSQELPLAEMVFSPFLLGPGSQVAETPLAYGVRPYPGWLNTYAMTSDLYNVPYFDLDGLDNIQVLNRFNPMVDHAYRSFRHRQLVDDADYAELLASVLDDMTAMELLDQTDILLNNEDFTGWDHLLARIRRAAEKNPQ